MRMCALPRYTASLPRYIAKNLELQKNTISIRKLSFCFDDIKIQSFNSHTKSILMPFDKNFAYILYYLTINRKKNFEMKKKSQKLIFLDFFSLKIKQAQ